MEDKSDQHLVLGKYSFEELLDIKQLEVLFTSFSDATGSSIALVSNVADKVYFYVGWNDLCQKFHRANELSLTQCNISNKELTGCLSKNKRYNILQCRNGLMDCATPIIINGVHLANILTGQFLFQKPDLKYFSEQAQKFGFDKDSYIDAVQKIPIVDETRARKMLEFLSDLAVSLAEKGLSKLIEKEAKASYSKIRNKFELITESSMDVAFVVDSKGTQKFISKSVKPIFGYEIDEQLGTFFGDFVPEEELPRFIEKLTEVYEGGEVENFTTKIKHKKGHFVDVEINGKMVIFDGERLALGSIRDITARKKAEDKLLKSESYNKALIEAVPDMIFVMDRNGLFKDFIPAPGVETVIPKELFIGKTLSDVMPEAVIGKSEKALKLLRETNEIQRFEYYISEDESRRYYEARLVSKGEEVVALVRDISERTKLEHALIDSEKRLRHLINTMPDIVCFKDGQGRWLEANNFDLELFEITDVDYKGKTDADLAKDSEFYKDAFLECELSDELAWQAGKITRVEEKIKTKIGEDRFFDVIKVPSFDKYGNREGLLVVGREITEKKKATQSLVESEALFRNLTESTSSGIVIYQDDCFVFANKAAEELTGYKREELVQMHFWDIVFQADLQIISERDQKEGEANTLPEKYEFRIKRKDGSVIWIHYSLKDTNWNGKPAIIGTAFDITRRKKAEIDIAKRENYFHQIFEKNKIITLIVDPANGSIVNANSAAAGFYGWSKQELQSMNIAQINTLPPPEIKKRMHDVLENNTGHLEFVHRLADGGVKNVEVFPSVVEVDNKKLFYVIIVDITEKHRVENQLKLLAKALEQSSNIVLVTDKNARIEYVNPSFEKQTGYDLEEVLGKKPSILKSGRHDMAFYREMWRTLYSGYTWQGELHNKKKDGETYWESATISPIFDNNDEITHFVAVKEDITYKKIIETDLVKAKEKAEESDRLKTSFLQNMSHEIRTPLNGILGFAQLLSDPHIDMTTVHYYSNIISTSGNRLLDLINNILDISKIESGDVKITKESVQLNEILENVGDLITLKAKSKGVELNLQYELSDQESSIQVDAGKLNQILINLLNNALKFTKEGEIVCSYKIKDQEIIFSIKDTGVGILPEQQERIFDRFYQADNSTNKAFEGAGLGLAISYSLVKLLGGEIWLESEVGVGTTFFFTIPYEPTRVHIHLSKEEPEVLASRKLNILVAEDDDTSYLFLETLLISYDVKIVRVLNGFEAVEACEEEKFDVVLMDINMPQMDGLEATKRIKKMYPKLPIIAQTAYAFTSEKNEALMAGCDEYLSKPIVKLALFKAIRDLVEDQF